MKKAIGLADKLTGGVLGLTPDTSAQDAAIAEQTSLLKKQEADLAAEEAKRKDRMGRARQGRRSLLYAEGDEAGVSKSTTLGG